jgi:hypothetical protein
MHAGLGEGLGLGCSHGCQLHLCDSPWRRTRFSGAKHGRKPGTLMRAPPSQHGYDRPVTGTEARRAGETQKCLPQALKHRRRAGRRAGRDVSTGASRGIGRSGRQENGGRLRARGQGVVYARGHHCHRKAANMGMERGKAGPRSRKAAGRRQPRSAARPAQLPGGGQTGDLGAAHEAGARRTHQVESVG